MGNSDSLFLFPVCMTSFFKQQHTVWNLGCAMVVLCMGKDLFPLAAAANSRRSGAMTPLTLCPWPPIKPRPNQLQHNSSLLVLNPQNLTWAFLEGHGGCWTFTRGCRPVQLQGRQQHCRACALLCMQGGFAIPSPVVAHPKCWSEGIQNHMSALTWS